MAPTAAFAPQAEAKILRMQRDQHRIHEVTYPTGTRVREYADGAGRVFAVSWGGPFRPNLRKLMGVHYQPYLEATRGRRMVRGPHRVELPGLVVIVAGRQRALFGKAYLTHQLPSGLRPEDIE